MNIDDTLKFIKSSFEQVIKQDAYRNYLQVNFQVLEQANKKLVLRTTNLANDNESQATQIDQLQSSSYEFNVRVESFIKDSASRFEKLLAVVNSLKTSCIEIEQSKSGIFSSFKKEQGKGNGLNAIFDDTTRLTYVVHDLLESHRTLKEGTLTDVYCSINESTQKEISQKLESSRKYISTIDGVSSASTDVSKSTVNNPQSLINELVDLQKSLLSKLVSADVKINLSKFEIEKLRSQNVTVNNKYALLEVDADKLLSKSEELSAKLSIFKAELDPEKTNAALHIKNKKAYLESIQAKGVSDPKKLIMLYSESISEMESMYNILIGYSTFRYQERPDISGLSFIFTKKEDVLDKAYGEFESQLVSCFEATGSNANEAVLLLQKYQDVVQDQFSMKSDLLAGLDSKIESLKSQLNISTVRNMRMEDQVTLPAATSNADSTQSNINSGFMSNLKRVQTRKEDVLKPKKTLRDLESSKTVRK